jgi:hypothetical protein
MRSRTRTAAKRAKLVAEWRASDLSQAAFARRHHIHPRTFWDWVRRVPGAEPVAITAPLVPVQVLADAGRPMAHEGVAILLPEGERLEVPEGTSPAWVAAILISLRHAC